MKARLVEQGAKSRGREFFFAEGNSEDLAWSAGKYAANKKLEYLDIEQES